MWRRASAALRRGFAASASPASIPATVAPLARAFAAPSTAPPPRAPITGAHLVSRAAFVRTEARALGFAARGVARPARRAARPAAPAAPSRRALSGGGYFRNAAVPPPPPHRFARSSRPPPAAPNFDGEQMLWTIVGANGFVFFLWHSLDPRFMRLNFAVSEASVYDGRLHTAVTAAFSHYDFMHLASNMLALYYFGRGVGQMFGPTYLLNLYLAGGVVASATHVAWCRRQRELRARRAKRRGGFIAQTAGRWMEHAGGGEFGSWNSYRSTPPALGASGAVNAVVLLNAALHPSRVIYLNFFIPMPNALFAGLFLARDLYGAQMGLGGSGTGHAAHLGGAAVGAAAWAAMRLGALRRGRRIGR